MGKQCSTRRRQISLTAAQSAMRSPRCADVSPHEPVTEQVRKERHMFLARRKT